MKLEFFPRSQLVPRLMEGWRLLPDHDYQTEEYAILMTFHAPNARLTDKELAVIEAKFVRFAGVPRAIVEMPRRSKLASLERYKRVTGYEWISVRKELSKDRKTKHREVQPVKTCAVEGCDSKRRTNGFCEMHRQRVSKHFKRFGVPGDPLIPSYTQTCRVDGCGEKHRARGLCNKHYHRLSKYGDYNIVKSKKGQKQSPETIAKRMARYWSLVTPPLECVQA